MMVKFFPKLASQPSDDSSNHYSSISRNSFRLMRGWKLEKLANGKDISSVPLRTVKRGLATSGSSLNGY